MLFTYCFIGDCMFMKHVKQHDKGVDTKDSQSIVALDHQGCVSPLI